MDKMRQTLSSSAVRTLMIVLAWIFLSSTARSQDYFPIGAWCFTTGGEKYDGENLHSTEKQKLKDLGLNYFIGCLGAKPEQALINYADDPGVTFKITVESTPLDYPAIPTHTRRGSGQPTTTGLSITTVSKIITETLKILIILIGHLL